MSVRTRIVGATAQQWGLTRRLLPKRHLPYPVRGGRVYLSLGNAPASLQRVLRTYEPNKFRNIERFLPRGGGFVDVGANAGDFSVWAARCGGPDTRVLAIEAEPENARWLQRTVELNRLGSQVSVVQVAASDSDGETELILTDWNGTHSIVENELHHEIEMFRPRGRVTVATRRLDDLIRESPLPRVDMVKIDVEGAELVVLRGAPELLAGPGPLTLLIDLHFGVDLDELVNLLHGHGFSIGSEENPDVVIQSVPDGTLSIVATRAG